MTEPLMTQALQLLLVVLVGVALAFYGHFKGMRERGKERQAQADPRQQTLFPKREHPQQAAELLPH
jgi:hypothetical protein